MSNDTTYASEYVPTANHWGTGIAELRDGRLEAVSGHPLDSDPSPINGNIREGLFGSARIRRPAVREGYLKNGPRAHSGKRGREPFVEISWETAFDLIERELKRVKGDFGNEAIFAGSYGWSSAGRFHHAQSQLKRFLNCIGGFVRSEGNYSYNAALVLMPHIIGSFRDQVKHATRWKTVAEHGELVVMFGGVPIRNMQVSGGGIARHRFREELEACKSSNVEFVNFSPLKTDALVEMGAQWYPPLPGSDTAILMGLAHTLIVNGLHDTAFLEKHTVGFEAIEAYLLGKEDGIVKDADWAGRISSISPQIIRDLAVKMAGSRTLICMAAGVQRAEHGEQPLWMCVTLAAMLGQIGLPGGGYGIAYGADASIGCVDRPFGYPSLPQGQNPVDTFIPVAAITDMLLKPGMDYEYNGKTMTYPDIRMVWWAGGNPFHHQQDLNLLSEAFQTPETVIVNELGWTATARHADIVLPVASNIERMDIGAGTHDNAIVPMPKIVPPVGEAMEEYAIYSRLADRFDVREAFTENRTTRDWLLHMWETLRETAHRNEYTLPDLDTFLAGDVIEFEDPKPRGVYLADFRSDPDANPLTTPSGRIELFSEVISGFGYDDCPGHAAWLPPTEWLGANLAGTYPLHLISGQPGTRLHSQLDSGTYSRSRKIKGREPVLIHPEDAKARGIADGDIVMLRNDRGRCLAGAIVTSDIRQSVVFLWTGAWFDPDWSDHENPLDRHGNPNVLTHDKRTSRLAQGPASQSALVELEKFTGPLPDIEAFTPPIVRK